LYVEILGDVFEYGVYNRKVLIMAANVAAVRYGVIVSDCISDTFGGMHEKHRNKNKNINNLCITVYIFVLYI
jgi:hypothetical protein